jgi:UDP-glucose 4-epimerase
VGRVVLVTGVARYLGAVLVRGLDNDPDVDRVIGMDVIEPPDDVAEFLGRTEFVHADTRNPILAKVIAAADVDTVVHASLVASPLGVGGRSSMKEINVIGTMQLLAACQKSPSVQRLVLRSTTAVYGSSPRDPAVYTEDMEPAETPRSGYAKDAVEVEGYVRGLARRRPDVDVTVLRFANFIGPRIETPFTRYFSMPVIPTALGYDARLQFVHEDDGTEVMRRATVGGPKGTYNVSGDGVLLLSQAARRAGRPTVAVPGPAVSMVGDLIRRAGVADFTPDQMAFLTHGRAVDCTLLKEQFGYTPRYTTVEAFDDFVRARGRGPVTPERVAAVERRLADAFATRGGSNG